MLLRYRAQHKLRSRAAVATNPDRKDRKGKDRKGEAATETSELGTTKSLDLLRASAESWYDDVYVNIRRRYSGGLTLLANYTWSKDLSNAPDFRSPMFESSVPQNNNDLAAEKGPACDVRHRFAFSAVYDIPAWDRSGLVRAVSKDWHLSSVYQVQTGFPFTISVFGDTANAGTELGGNPIRANVRGSHCFPRELAPPKIGSIRRHLPRLRLIRSGMRDAIQFIGRARKRWIWRWSATLV
jgi:hypothetical protein